MPDNLELISIGRNLSMYHQYKHQRATKHLIELYEAYFTDCMTETESIEKATTACFQLDRLNSRIRELNQESNVPDDLGLIDYGAFLYGWRRVRDESISPDALEKFCRREQYMNGWSYLPPRHQYNYLPAQIRRWTQEWDVIVRWLSLIWHMLRCDQSLVSIDQLESTLLAYVSNIDFTRNQHHTFDMLSSLHKMKACLHIKRDGEYEDEREKLRSMCVFWGYPSKWIPRGFGTEGGE